MPALDRLVQFSSDPQNVQRIDQTRAFLRCRYLDAVILEWMSDILDGQEAEWEELTPDDVEAWLAEQESDEDEEEDE